MKHDRVVLAERREEAGPKRLDAAFRRTGPDTAMIAAPTASERNSKGLGLDRMADGIGRYWFVAAVFRDPQDLAEAIRQMRAGGLSGRFCVLANRGAAKAHQALEAAADDAGVGVITLDGSSGMSNGKIATEPAGMRVLLESMDGRGDPDASDGDARPHVYTQLHEDMREGALVLLACVDGPDEQVVGARLLLKGNCECVLTHEIKTAAAP